jgi:hypothetical protein
MRFVIPYIFSFTFCILFYSCSDEEQKDIKKQGIIFENDMEPHEWGGAITIKERPNAHSGKSVSVMDSINAYSLIFVKPIDDISKEKIKSVTYSYWIFMKNANAKANTVLSIDSNDKNILWAGRPVAAKELNKWAQVIETFDLPDTIEPKYSLRLYVWNISKEEILVDDFKIVVN